MITEDLVRFYEARPFQPFGLALMNITVYDADGRQEVIDTDKIVLLRTLAPARST